MKKITAETANGTVAFEAEEGKKLVLAIEDSGIDILHRCGGNARCTTCRVEILGGDPGEIREPERAILSTKTDLNDHTRLSCQIRIADDLHVKVINQVSVKGLDAGPRPADYDTP
jgi:ferredoxin